MAEVAEVVESSTSLLDEVMAASLGVTAHTLKQDDGFLAIKKSSKTFTPTMLQEIMQAPQKLAPPLVTTPEALPNPVVEEPLYLPDIETATHDKQVGVKSVSIASQPIQTSNKPYKKSEKVGRTLNIAGKSIELLAPVSPNTDKQMAKLVGPSEPPEAAVAFMRWLQEGIVSGDIQINQAIAQVHFVQLSHPAIAKGVPQSLMLLVTPLCFRDFAESNQQFGDSKTVQSAFIKAKWHVTAETGNINILRFKTPSSSNGTPKLLSCIGVQYPEKFVNPVPGPNELLTYDDAMTRQFMTKPKEIK
jgi:hypothetical protein